MMLSDQEWIEFYRSSAVHEVLKNYTLSAEQKAVFRAAILQSRRPKPNMSQIHSATVLLQELEADPSKDHNTATPEETIPTQEKTAATHTTPSTNLEDIEREYEMAMASLQQKKQTSKPHRDLGEILENFTVFDLAQTRETKYLMYGGGVLYLIYLFVSALWDFSG